jgi:hypothetical protein
MPLWGRYAHTHPRTRSFERAVEQSKENRQKVREYVRTLSSLVDQIEQELPEGD